MDQVVAWTCLTLITSKPRVAGGIPKQSFNNVEYGILGRNIYGYAPVIRLKMAISGRHAHIHADKTDISR